MTDPLGHDASVPAFLRRQGPFSSQARQPDAVVPPPPRAPEGAAPAPADPPFVPAEPAPPTRAAAAPHAPLPSLDFAEAVSVLDQPCTLPSLKTLDALLSVRVQNPEQRLCLAAALIPHSGRTLTTMELLDLVTATSLDDTHPCTLMGYVVDDLPLLNDLYFELAGVPANEALELDTATAQRLQSAIEDPTTGLEAMQSLQEAAPRNSGLLDLVVRMLSQHAQPKSWLPHETLGAFGPLAYPALRTHLQPSSQLANAGQLLFVVRAMGPFARPLLPQLFNLMSWRASNPSELLHYFQALCVAGPPASMLDAITVPLVRKLAQEPPAHPDASLRADCQVRARALLSLADV